MRVFDQYLNAWGQVDQNTYSYGKIGIDDFVFELDEDGDAVSIEPRILGLKLMRIQGILGQQSLLNIYIKAKVAGFSEPCT